MNFRLLVLGLSLLLSSFSFGASVLVGLASKDITPSVTERIPLGGYGSFDRRNWPPKLYRNYPILPWFAPAKGSLDPIRAKVMYVKNLNQKLLFVSLDVIGVTKEMRSDLINRMAKTGWDVSNVIISGTHTHSGPGALSENLFWQIFAMDRFQRKYYEKFMNQVMDTIQDAILKAAPADLYTLSFATKGLVRNRRGNDRPINPNANFILAQNASGEWMGGIVNYAVHGTSLGSESLFFSADTPGAIERSLEKLLIEMNGLIRPLSSPTFLFVNGAEGDVSPNLSSHHLMGEEFAIQTQQNWDSMQPLIPNWSVLHKKVKLYKPRISLSKCIDKKWMPKNVNIGVRTFIPSTTYINQIRFGSLWLLTWPGEATTEIGLRLTEEARMLGAQNAWVFGLSNDHLAYFTTPEEFQAGGYESCVNFFGEQGGLTIINAHKKLSISNSGHL